MNMTTLAYVLLRYSGLPFLFREVLFRKATRIIVLHDPEPEAMRRALMYLGARYSFISLADHLGERPLPPKPLVITLDDGHIGNRALLDVFREFKVRPTIFLCAGIVGTRRHFWFRYAGLKGSSEQLKRIPDAERRAALANMGFTDEQEYDHPQALGSNDLSEMKPYVDLQAHTVFHPCLPMCDDAVARNEIGDAGPLLSRLGLGPITAFAFPNGDYCQRDLDLVKASGYTCAVTVDYGFNKRGEDPFRLKRLSVDDRGEIDGLSVKVSGVWSLFNAMLGRQRLSRFVRSPGLAVLALVPTLFTIPYL